MTARNWLLFQKYVHILFFNIHIFFGYYFRIWPSPKKDLFILSIYVFWGVESKSVIRTLGPTLVFELKRKNCAYLRFFFLFFPYNSKTNGDYQNLITDLESTCKNSSSNLARTALLIIGLGNLLLHVTQHYIDKHCIIWW